MRITNLEKGEAYQLSEGAKMEIERTNPFFNDYGEQSIPLDLPASEHNRRLLGYPDIFGRTDKMAKTKASIQDGEYFAQCQQFVLSAQHKGSISTTFYINDGSFYARIQNIKLRDVFADDIITFSGSDIPTRVKNGIAFCKNLRSGTDERFAIFPVLLTDDSGIDSGYNYKILNAFGKQVTQRMYLRSEAGWGGHYGSTPPPHEDVSLFLPDSMADGSDFYNAQERVEYVNEIAISLAAGYYISPFVRTSYVLKKLFKHFGYTLKENFFTKTEPFNNMVLLNNVIDVLVNGQLKVADLLPDVTVSDFLSVFRKKFCCEFTSDEGAMTADVIFLRDVVASKPVADLTQCLTAEPTIQYKSAKDFKRVILSSKNTLDTDAEDSYDDIKSLLSNNPGAYLDYYTGAFYKTGFSGNYGTKTKVAEASMAYNTGEDTDEQKIEVPDCMPEFRTLLYHGEIDGNGYDYTMGQWLYVGDYTTLNSKLTMTGDDEQDTEEDSGKALPMLAFAYMSGTKPAGTISAYDLQSTAKPRIFDYALYYYGEDGIFEKFYRDCDTLYRNSLQQIKMKLLLSQSQKQNLAAYAKVVVRGTAFFFNKLKFSLGGKDEPIESEMLTIALTDPVAESKHITDMLPTMTAKYKWVGKIQETEVSKDDYNNSGVNKDRTFTVVYPPTPTAEWVGKEYGKQVSYTAEKTRHATMFRHSKWKYTKTTCWLTVVSATSIQESYLSGGGTVGGFTGGHAGGAGGGTFGGRHR